MLKAATTIARTTLTTAIEEEGALSQLPPADESPRQSRQAAQPTTPTAARREPLARLLCAAGRPGTGQRSIETATVLPVSRFLVALVVCITLAACGPKSTGGPPEHGDYTLTWYPREGTDYGVTTPSFKSLAMCRRGGAGMTTMRLIEAYGVRESYEDAPRRPWFECGTDCRPHARGSNLIVCGQIAEFHGQRAEADSEIDFSGPRPTR